MNNKEISKYIALSDRQTEFEFTVKNNYDFSLKRQNIRLDLIEEADGFLVLSYKGLRYPVEIVSRKQNEYEILLNGVAYTFSVETPFSLKRKKILASRQSDLATIIIKSPMPGKILDVQVDNGQEINKGDTLLILEAMKMQNIITATHRGRISRLCVKTGQIVGKDRNFSRNQTLNAAMQEHSKKIQELSNFLLDYATTLMAVGSHTSRIVKNVTRIAVSFALGVV